MGRDDVSEPASISSGIAARYATAMFELAKSDGQLPTLEADVDALDAALHDSADLQAMIRSPLYARDAQQSAITAVAKAMKLSPLFSNTLSLIASKRRLFVLPQFLLALREMIAEENGETTAEVTSAVKLTDAQSDKLAKTLKSAVGKTVKIKATVDESLIGGLVVKVGSRMIDSSIAAKLANLQNSMKEVG
ncbi:F0F1 ATP synthase subunit delta [Pseudoruegeria sp. SK021]|nr:F0F1 ATP synthase subunit delta [Pseudoruegeria sp. SK021]